MTGNRRGPQKGHSFLTHLIKKKNLSHKLAELLSNSSDHIQ